MRRTGAERRRRAKNRAQRAKRRVLFVYEQDDEVLQGRVIEQAGTQLTIRERRMYGSTTVVQCADEGRRFVYGWHGEAPDAFRAAVALTGAAA